MENINQTLKEIKASLQALHVKIDALTSGSEQSLSPTPTIRQTQKKITLPELARNNSLENGQERVAAIVGYNEKILIKTDVQVSDIQQGWKEGKFHGAYAPVYLSRAIKDGLVRQKGKNTYDLTQSGEDFFEVLLNK
ncbi:MAG: hypothetical protein AAB618_00330 [Patescibacteria group bacterium]